MTTTLILGFGYLGREVAALMCNPLGTVYGTTRSRRKFSQIAERGCVPLQVDWTDARSLEKVPQVDRVLISVAYDPTCGHDRDTLMRGGLVRFLDRVSQWSRDNPNNRPTQITYISTTGVYHQSDGQWVDETSTTRPCRAGAKAHLRAESQLRSWASRQSIPRQSTAGQFINRNPSVQAVTLRMSGIYGRQRIPRAAHIREGQPIASAASGYLNLIHVQDAARAVIASWELDWERGADETLRVPYQTYCISDHEPVVRQAFYESIADCYDAPQPTFVESTKDVSDRMRSTSNKRVWNRKMTRHLLPKLAYPNYREGLRDALADSTIRSPSKD